MTMNNEPVFQSFVWAGFECTYGRNEEKRRMDLLRDSKHDVWCREDYQLVTEIGVRTVREGLCWSQIDTGGSSYDFSRFEPMMAIGKELGVEQIWDLNHFDYPDYLDPFSEEFVTRFATYARAAIRIIRKYNDKPLYIVPINEISFFAWIGADRGSWAPYTKGEQNGFRFKKQLVRASIAAMNAMWAEDSHVRFIQVDPFMRRVARKPANSEAIAHARSFNDVVRFQAWDMLGGYTYPEVGGGKKYLDIIGVNYYFHNQEWVLSKGKKGIGHDAMKWQSPYRVPVHKMFSDVHRRYGRPMVMSETGSFGDLRYRWWSRTLAQVEQSIQNNVPFYGICAYPTVDRPEWAGFLLPNSGLWDFHPEDRELSRVPHERSLALLKRYAKRFAGNVGNK